MKLLLLCVVLLGTTFHTITMVAGQDSSTVKLYTRTKQMKDLITQVEATDGDKYLLAVYQPSTGFVNCYTVSEKDKLASLTPPVMEDASTVTFDLDEQKVNELFLFCEIQFTHLKAVKFLASLTNTTAPDTDNSRPGPVFYRAARVTAWAIFPGTKWCGSGSNADDYDDLGDLEETDRCCRTHDHCTHFIQSLSEKYGYFNWYLWTLSHCDCDTEFKTCLQQVSHSEAIASATVKNIFFTVLGIRCFNLDANDKAQVQ